MASDTQPRHSFSMAANITGAIVRMHAGRHAGLVHGQPQFMRQQPRASESVKTC